MITTPQTDEEILATCAVMRELRPHVPEAEYVATVRRMMASDGYRLAACHLDGAVAGVAGFRILEMLYSGRSLYVDDLSTAERFRSRGCGKALLDWLDAEAARLGCKELHLDSGVQREAAHRFYFRERMVISSFHFRKRVQGGTR
jgi:GNAT superfamily N-acetyltransferase